ncbi:helix-turn-helix domain-containing protein [Lacrimispora sp.]|uniref:helix-turn-helix domain-containing protein n=1 Tax=Lacrimispora sp. TaxID=2719234 RepID=UPI0028B154BD|nr:helix-turn-helix transcriptional regulator [Lacrimispora sp.]
MLYGNIKALCDKRNLSISQLERDLGFPRSSICKWDENEPSIWKVKKVAKLLGVTVDSLLEEDLDA